MLVVEALKKVWPELAAAVEKEQRAREELDDNFKEQIAVLERLSNLQSTGNSDDEKSLQIKRAALRKTQVQLEKAVAEKRKVLKEKLLIKKALQGVSTMLISEQLKTLIRDINAKNITKYWQQDREKKDAKNARARSCYAWNKHGDDSSEVATQYMENKVSEAEAVKEKSIRVGCDDSLSGLKKEIIGAVYTAVKGETLTDEQYRKLNVSNFLAGFEKIEKQLQCLQTNLILWQLRFDALKAIGETDKDSDLHHQSIVISNQAKALTPDKRPNVRQLQFQLNVIDEKLKVLTLTKKIKAIGNKKANNESQLTTLQSLAETLEGLKGEELENEKASLQQVHLTLGEIDEALKEQLKPKKMNAATDLVTGGKRKRTKKEGVKRGGSDWNTFIKSRHASTSNTQSGRRSSQRRAAIASGYATAQVLGNSLMSGIGGGKSVTTDSDVDMTPPSSPAL